jgi:hypothetical protein
MVVLKLKEAGLRQHAAVKIVTMNTQLYCLAFAKHSVDHQWERVMFCNKSTFSSANDGPLLVYRPQEEQHKNQYVAFHR